MEIPKVFIFGVAVNESGKGQPPYDFSADIVFIDRSSKGIHPSVYQVTNQHAHPQEITQATGLLMIGEVLSISRKNKKIFLADGNTVSYNYLILVTETRSNVFLSNDPQEFTTALRALSEALKMRQNIPAFFGNNITLLDSHAKISASHIASVDESKHSVSLTSLLSTQSSQNLASLSSRDMDRLFEIVL